METKLLITLLTLLIRIICIGAQTHNTEVESPPDTTNAFPNLHPTPTPRPISDDVTFPDADDSLGVQVDGNSNPDASDEEEYKKNTTDANCNPDLDHNCDSNQETTSDSNPNVDCNSGLDQNCDKETASEPNPNVDCNPDRNCDSHSEPTTSEPSEANNPPTTPSANTDSPPSHPPQTPCPNQTVLSDLGHDPQRTTDQHCQDGLPATTLEPSNVTEEALSPAEIGSQLPLWRAGIMMHQFYLPLLVPTGAIGNILSFLVMIQPQNRKNSCCNYMAALAVTDACMIYVAAHYWVVTSGFFRAIYYYECKMLAWTFNLFSLMGIFIILFMTIDRFIVVRFPLKAPTMCTPKRARITVAAIVILMTAYTAPYLYTSGLVNNSTCAAITTSTLFTTIYSWVNVFLVSILPFVSLLVLNAYIIRTIRNRRKYFENQQEQKNNREAQLTVMLLIVTFTFLLLTLPLYARYVFTIAIDYTSNPTLYALYIFLYHLSNKLYFTNNAINFYLYCVGGAKFRKDLRSLCCGRDKGAASTQNNSSVSAGNNNSSTVISNSSV